MEFIPLERPGSKNKKRESVQKPKNEKILKEGHSEVIPKKVKSRVFEKKKVKNKYKETLALKQKQRVPKKKTAEKKIDDDDGDDDLDDDNNITPVEKEDSIEEEEVDKEEQEDEIYKRKCQEMDEKKKNRLFIKLKKKILNEAQIKELHPDIRGVIFPRKKNSRWCWAVFASEERADEAMKKLIKKKDVLVSKPTPYDKVDKKNKEKMKTILRRKEERKKLQKIWVIFTEKEREIVKGNR